MTQTGEFSRMAEGDDSGSEQQAQSAERWLGRASDITRTVANNPNQEFIDELCARMALGDVGLTIILAGLEVDIETARTPWTNPSDECAAMRIQINALKLCNDHLVPIPNAQAQ